MIAILHQVMTQFKVLISASPISYDRDPVLWSCTIKIKEGGCGKDDDLFLWLSMNYLKMSIYHMISNIYNSPSVIIEALRQIISSYHKMKNQNNIKERKCKIELDHQLL